MTNRTSDLQCIHRAGCTKPKVCGEVGHCTSMTETDLKLHADMSREEVDAVMTRTAAAPSSNERVAISAEGSELMMELFNRMPIESLGSVPEPIAKRIGDFMVANGYRIVFNRWYLQADPKAPERSADETTDVLKTIYRLAGGHAIECQCRQCEIFELLEPIVGNSSRSAVDPPVAHKHWCAKLAPSVYTAMDCNCGAVKPIAPTDHVHSWDGDKCHYCQFPKRSYLALECERLAALAKDFDGFTSDTLQTLVARNRSAEKATEPLPTCQHDLLQPNTTIAVDPADPFHAWCTVCKHDFRTRAPLNDGGERCANWPCQLINGHAGPCASSPENGKEGQS